MNLKQKIAVLLVAVLLVACNDSSRELKFSAMPDELSDCKVFYVQSRDSGSMTVVRCPNAATTTKVSTGKTNKTTVVIDGVNYVPESNK